MAGEKKLTDKLPRNRLIGEIKHCLDGSETEVTFQIHTGYKNGYHLWMTPTWLGASADNDITVTSFAEGTMIDSKGQVFSEQEGCFVIRPVDETTFLRKLIEAEIVIDTGRKWGPNSLAICKLHPDVLQRLWRQVM